MANRRCLTVCGSLRNMSGQVCQHCGENPATIHFTEIKEEDRIELHVCEECAAAQGITSETNMPTILAGVVAAAARSQEMESKECPHCGITFRDFRRRGRLGCPRDYEVFEELLEPLISKMHGGAERHVGRLPRGQQQVHNERPDRLLRLRRDLQEAIDQERYETAARLRDEILTLEGDSAVEGDSASGGDNAAGADGDRSSSPTGV